MQYCKNVFDEENTLIYLAKSANHLKEALKYFEWLFDNLEGKDLLKISILDRFVTTYQALVQVLIVLRRSDEALLASERGRARTLRDLLVSQHGLTQKYDSRSADMNYDGIHALLQNGRFSIAFFALFHDKCHLWRLTHEETLFFDLISTDNANGFLAKSLDAAIDEMRVTAQVNCEDRSLDILEKDDGNFERRDGAAELFLLAGRINKDSQQGSRKQENHHPRNFWPEEKDDSIDHLEVLYKVLVPPVQRDLTRPYCT